MVRNSITLVPLIGVFMALIAFAAANLASVQVQVPRKLDDTCCGCDERAATVRVDLHADSSAELDVDGQRSHIDAPRLSTAVRTTVDEQTERVDAVYLNPDDNTSWQQVVEATSSIAHASGREVALMTPPE